MSLVPTISSGSGRIVVTLFGSAAVLSDLSYTYPLKLLSPTSTRKDVSIVYLLSYGGGLVGGDQIDLSVQVDERTSLVLLTQGSTKVFKARPGGSVAAPGIKRVSLTGPHPPPLITRQTMDVAVAGALFLLPDPVTCFRSASYHQIQRFNLKEDASLVVLDWITSGRMSLGESWAFSRYHSVNEVWREGRLIAKDITLLDGRVADSGAPLTSRTLADRLSPYACYATVMLCGPLVQSTIGNLVTQYSRISVFKNKMPEECIWSLSCMTSGPIGSWAVVRVAGTETEVVREWLRHSLTGMQDIIGLDTYRRAFA